MSNDVAVRGPASALAIADGQTGFTEQQIAALEQLGVKDAGPGDLAVFFHQATRTGLDPFAKQIYMIGRWSREGTKQTIQTGIDGYRLIARRAADRSHETLEYEDTLWCGADGVWRDVWLSAANPPAAAKVTVLRNGGRFPAIALWNEYVQTNRDGSPSAMWAQRGAGQLAKCAEALALRRAFPQDLSGIYTDEEMGQADARAEQGVDAVPSQRVTPPRAGQRVVDGEAAARPAPPATADVEGGRSTADWLADLAACGDLDCTRTLYREAKAAGVLEVVVDGTALYLRIQARAAEITKDAERAAAEAEAAAAEDAPDDVPEGVGEPIDPTPAAADPVGDGTPEAPLEGELLPPLGEHQMTEPDTEDVRRPTAQRRALVTQLIELLGSKEAMEATCEQEFGFAVDLVGTRRLREWLQREQRAARTQDGQ